MKRILGTASLLFLTLSPASFGYQAATGYQAAPSSQRALLDKYCVTCHNQKLKTAGLTLDKEDVDHVGTDPAVWEKVIRKLHMGSMPPLGLPRPEKPALDNLAVWLETSLDKAEASNVNPGRTAIHRLNRTEYANAIHDVLALDIDATALLPGDDEANGFDNIADVLKVSPLLLEQYIAASRKVSALAVGDPKTPPVAQIYRIPPDLAQDLHIEGLPLGTRGGVMIKHNFPLDGEYDFSVGILRNIVGYMTGFEFEHKLEISVDGVRVFTAKVGGPDDLKMMDTNLGVAGEAIDARLKARVPVKAGPHKIGVTFVERDHAESDEPLEPFTRDTDLQNMNGIPLIDHLDVAGPFNSTGSGDTPSRRKIFICRPAKNADELPCAKQILTTLARRAYRRPVTDADTENLLSFYQAGRNKGNFDSGIESALRLMLADPKFIFRTELDPASLGSVHRVNDLELASRLSFFLWSTIPDDQLITLASQGKLKDPAVLEQQVKRMLSDPRSEALVNNFGGQWLFLRNLKSAAPDTEQFPNFDDNLRQAFRRETELLLGSVMHEDRSVLDLLNANYTFVNDRLAKHYGIPNIYGSQFRRVTLTDENRRGLLGQGSVLTVTSYPNRTSVVLRGKWILENILGTPPPAPPPNVPALKENGERDKPQSMKQLMAEHRANPACASCHKIMDPLGFSLENFDAIGQWRVKEPAGPIDASGQLGDGTPVTGPKDLRAALLARPQQFVSTMTEKMLTYALGRGLDYYDMPIVRSIVSESAKSDYRFSSIVMGIVKSPPFQMRKAEEPKNETPKTVAAR